MYGGTARNHFYRGLSADDVNIAQMSRTGVDLDAGTADDYTVDLQSVVSPSGSAVLTIFINSDLDWAFGVPLFVDGFESGDLSEWDATVP